jgi:ATP-dependent Clp protease ATP-binding subunit ClpA
MEEFYDAESGARPLKRAVENLIEDPVAEKIVSGDFKYGDSVKISVSGSKLTYTKSDRTVVVYEKQ